MVSDWQGRPGTGTHIVEKPYLMANEVGGIVHVPASEGSLAFSPSDYLTDGDIVIDTELRIGVLGSSEDGSGDYTVETKGVLSVPWGNVSDKPFSSVDTENSVLRIVDDVLTTDTSEIEAAVAQAQADAIKVGEALSEHADSAQDSMNALENHVNLAIEGINAAINAVVVDRDVADQVLKEAIEAESTARQEADSAVSDSVGALENKVNEVGENLTGAIAAEAAAREEADTALRSAIDAVNPVVEYRDVRNKVETLAKMYEIGEEGTSGYFSVLGNPVDSSSKYSVLMYKSADRSDRPAGRVLEVSGDTVHGYGVAMSGTFVQSTSSPYVLADLVHNMNRVVDTWWRQADGTWSNQPPIEPGLSDAAGPWLAVDNGTVSANIDMQKTGSLPTLSIGGQQNVGSSSINGIVRQIVGQVGGSNSFGFNSSASDTIASAAASLISSTPSLDADSIYKQYGIAAAGIACVDNARLIWTTQFGKKFLCGLKEGSYYYLCVVDATSVGSNVQTVIEKPPHEECAHVSHTVYLATSPIVPVLYEEWQQQNAPVAYIDALLSTNAIERGSATDPGAVYDANGKLFANIPEIESIPLEFIRSLFGKETA